MCLDSDKKILHLCSEHVIAMSSRKRKEKYHQLVFSEVCLEHVQVICWRSCLKLVVVCDYSDPKTSIPCAYIITTKTMAQGVHKLGASWGMTQCRF